MLATGQDVGLKFLVLSQKQISRVNTPGSAGSFSACRSPHSWGAHAPSHHASEQALRGCHAQRQAPQVTDREARFLV